MAKNANGDEIIEVRGGIEYVKKEFEEKTPQAGFDFIVPQAVTLESATDKYSEKTVLSIFNAYLSQMARMKVKNGLPKFADDKKADEAAHYANLAKEGRTCLFTIEEAEKWEPGVREKTVKQWFDEAKEYKKLRDEAKAKGDMEEFARFKALVSECMEKATALMSAGM